MGQDVLDVMEQLCATVCHVTVDQLVTKNVPVMAHVIMGRVIVVLRDGVVQIVKSRAVQDGVKIAQGMEIVYLQQDNVYVDQAGVVEAARYLCVQEVVIVAIMVFVMALSTTHRSVQAVMWDIWGVDVNSAVFMEMSVLQSIMPMGNRPTRANVMHVTMELRVIKSVLYTVNARMARVRVM